MFRFTRFSLTVATIVPAPAFRSVLAMSPTAIVTAIGTAAIAGTDGTTAMTTIIIAANTATTTAAAIILATAAKAGAIVKSVYVEIPGQVGPPSLAGDFELSRFTL